MPQQVRVANVEGIERFQILPILRATSGPDVVIRCPLCGVDVELPRFDELGTVLMRAATHLASEHPEMIRV